MSRITNSLRASSTTLRCTQYNPRFYVDMHDNLILSNVDYTVSTMRGVGLRLE